MLLRMDVNPLSISRSCPIINLHFVIIWKISIGICPPKKKKNLEFCIHGTLRENNSTQDFVLTE